MEDALGEAGDNLNADWSDDMSRPIQEGDRVECVWTYGSRVIGEVDNMPAATGDLLYITSEIMGTKLGINMGASTFEIMRKLN